jgi:hypothetical protein
MQYVPEPQNAPPQLPQQDAPQQPQYVRQSQQPQHAQQQEPVQALAAQQQPGHAPPGDQVAFQLVEEACTEACTPQPGDCTERDLVIAQAAEVDLQLTRGNPSQYRRMIEDYQRTFIRLITRLSELLDALHRDCRPLVSTRIDMIAEVDCVRANEQDPFVGENLRKPELEEMRRDQADYANVLRQAHPIGQVRMERSYAALLHQLDPQREREMTLQRVMAFRELLERFDVLLEAGNDASADRKTVANFLRLTPNHQAQAIYKEDIDFARLAGYAGRPATQPQFEGDLVLVMRDVIGQGDCLPLSLAFALWGNVENGKLVRLMSAISVSNDEDVMNLIVDDPDLPKRAQRSGAGLEAYLKFVVQPGNYLGELELAGFMRGMNEYLCKNNQWYCAVWMTTLDSDYSDAAVAAKLAGPPDLTYPANARYAISDTNCIRLVFEDTGNVNTCHYRPVAVIEADRLPREEQCSFCMKVVAEWFELTAKERLGDMSCTGCMEGKRGRFHSAVTHTAEEELPQEMFGDNGNMKPEWVEFFMRRCADRARDQLLFNEKQERKSLIDVERYWIWELVLTTQKLSYFYIAQELRATSQFGKECVMFRRDPSNGNSSHALIGASKNGLWHQDGASPWTFSSLVALTLGGDQSVTPMRELKWDFEEFGKKFAVELAAAEKKTKKGLYPDKSRWRTGNWGPFVIKSRDIGLRHIVAFVTTAVASLRKAIGDMPLCPAPRYADGGETTMFMVGKMNHTRPGGDQDDRKLVYTAGMLRPDSMDGETWAQTRLAVIAGTFRSASMSTEFPLNTEVPTETRKSAEFNESALLEMLLTQMIDWGYRLNEPSNQLLLHRNLARAITVVDSALPDQTTSTMRAIVEGIGGPHPSWQTSLIVCTGLIDKVGWISHGDNYTFLMVTICQIISGHEQETALFWRKDSLDKFEHKSNMNDDAHHYVSAGKKLGMTLAQFAKARTSVSLEEDIALRDMLHEIYVDLQESIAMYKTEVNFRLYNPGPYDEYDFVSPLNMLMKLWALEFDLHGEASTATQAAWEILGLMSFEAATKVALIETAVLAHQDIDNELSRFLYLFTHCLFALCNYGTLGINRHDEYAGSFNPYQLYLMACRFFGAMLKEHEFSQDASIHRTTLNHFELLCELGTCILLFEERGQLYPPGMAIGPLYFFELANQYLMLDSGKLADNLNLGKKTKYIAAHHHITFLLFRATVERALLWKYVPTLPVHQRSWLTRFVTWSLPTVILTIIEKYVGEKAPETHAKPRKIYDLTGD